VEEEAETPTPPRGMEALEQVVRRGLMQEAREARQGTQVAPAMKTALQAQSVRVNAAIAPAGMMRSAATALAVPLRVTVSPCPPAKVMMIAAQGSSVIAIGSVSLLRGRAVRANFSAARETSVNPVAGAVNRASLPVSAVNYRL